MTNPALDPYVPSDALRGIILKSVQHRFPDVPVTAAAMERFNEHISLSIRGLISTIGLSLSAENNETASMTSAGLLTDDVVKCYAFRLPVCSEDVPLLSQAIAEDLYKYAGQPAMVMASARLEVRDGELVVVGLATRKKREPGGSARATVVALS